MSELDIRMMRSLTTMMSLLWYRMIQNTSWNIA